MGSGGTEWETADQFDPIRLNQKTSFIGKGTQHALITSPQAGQQCFINHSSGGYSSGRYVTRNGANNTWYMPRLVEGAEEQSGSTAAGSSPSTAGTRYYHAVPITLPSSAKYYLITGLECRTPTTGASSFIMGVDLVESTSHSLNSTPLVALAAEKTSPSNGTNYKITQISSKVLMGGMVIKPWIEQAGTQISSVNTASPANKGQKTKSYSNSPTMVNNDAFVSGSATALIVYYRGYT